MFTTDLRLDAVGYVANLVDDGKGGYYVDLVIDGKHVTDENGLVPGVSVDKDRAIEALIRCRNELGVVGVWLADYGKRLMDKYRVMGCNPDRDEDAYTALGHELRYIRKLQDETLVQGKVIEKFAQIHVHKKG